jgi:hypothetical protein
VQTRSLLDALWKRNFPPADTREIWEWAHDEGELPDGIFAVPGRFDIGMAPFAKDVFRALKNPLVRTVTSFASVQSLKTLIGEIWLLWLVCNDAGPTQWVHPDDQEAKEHAKERFLPLLRAFPAVQSHFSEDRHDRTTSAIFFRHMWMRFEGALNRGNAQRKSVKNQMCSEVWQGDKWKPGTLQEFASRLTRFSANSKRYIETQPGFTADMKQDDAHAAYLAGTQNVWHVACLGCGKFQPMHWSLVRPDGSRAGMRWEKSARTQRETNATDPNEVWRWTELRQTVRWECEFCGHAHADEPLTRRRLLEGGKFVSQNPEASPEHQSFTWNQLIMADLNWFETQSGGVKNWLLANADARQGYDKSQREFIQKVLAQPYDPRKFAHFTKLATVELGEQQTEAPEIEVEGIKFVHRIAAVDVQAASFWVLVEAWSANGDSLSLWAGELFTWEDVAAKLKEFAVPDESVMVDWSHRGAEVVHECAKHGHWWSGTAGGRAMKKWLCWKAMRGADQMEFQCAHREAGRVRRVVLPYTWPPKELDPANGLSLKDPRRGQFIGKTVALFRWSNPVIKDIEQARRTGKAPAIRNLTARGDWNDELARQLSSGRKEFERGKWRWLSFRDDHLRDCKCMVIVRALQLHLFANSPAPPSQ